MSTVTITCSSSKPWNFVAQWVTNGVSGYPGGGGSMQSAGAGSPLGPRTTSPPESATQQTPGATTQSPMAALMSVADTLPPGSPRSAGGSPPGAGGPRSASRGSQHSPNSSGNYTISLPHLLWVRKTAIWHYWKSSSGRLGDDSKMIILVIWITQRLGPTFSHDPFGIQMHTHYVRIMTHPLTCQQLLQNT